MLLPDYPLTDKNQREMYRTYLVSPDKVSFVKRTACAYAEDELVTLLGRFFERLVGCANVLGATELAHIIEEHISNLSLQRVLDAINVCEAFELLIQNRVSIVDAEICDMIDWLCSCGWDPTEMSESGEQLIHLVCKAGLDFSL